LKYSCNGSVHFLTLSVYVLCTANIVIGVASNVVQAQRHPCVLEFLKIVFVILLLFFVKICHFSCNFYKLQNPVNVTDIDTRTKITFKV